MKDLTQTVLRHGCHKCRASPPAWGIGLYITSVGQRRFAYYCKLCFTRTTLYEPLTDKSAESQIDVVWDLSQSTECEVCGMAGAQLHHWAPRYLFGNESERWPQGRLCQICHTHWHQLVTPLMSQKKA